jgi:hypothetical protein
MDICFQNPVNLLPKRYGHLFSSTACLYHTWTASREMDVCFGKGMEVNFHHK